MKYLLTALTKLTSKMKSLLYKKNKKMKKYTEVKFDESWEHFSDNVSF